MLRCHSDGMGCGAESPLDPATFHAGAVESDGSEDDSLLDKDDDEVLPCDSFSDDEVEFIGGIEDGCCDKDGLEEGPDVQGEDFWGGHSNAFNRIRMGAGPHTLCGRMLDEDRASSSSSVGDEALECDWRCFDDAGECLGAGEGGRYVAEGRKEEGVFSKIASALFDADIRSMLSDAVTEDGDVSGYSFPVAGHGRRGVFSSGMVTATCRGAGGRCLMGPGSPVGLATIDSARSLDDADVEPVGVELTQAVPNEDEEEEEEGEEDAEPEEGDEGWEREAVEEDPMRAAPVTLPAMGGSERDTSIEDLRARAHREFALRMWETETDQNKLSKGFVQSRRTGLYDLMAAVALVGAFLCVTLASGRVCNFGAAGTGLPGQERDTGCSTL